MSRVMTMARLFVNIDTRDGLVVEVTFSKGVSSFSQKLDYVKLPFHCVRCHKYGHLVK